MIEEIPKRFIDDGFTLWPKNASINVFVELEVLFSLLTKLKAQISEKRNRCECKDSYLVHIDR